MMSPYITSRTAESVIDAGPVCTVYTLFEVEVFASGGSSLKTLKKLLEAGHDLFHLPNLHAKVVLSPDTFVSVGSQNLTHRGTKNKELTAAFFDPEASSAISRVIEPWVAERQRITTDMISDMEELLGPVTKLFVEAQDAAADAQSELTARQARRAVEEKLRLELVALRSQRLQSLRDAISAHPKSRDKALGKVVEIQNYSEAYYHQTSVSYSLLCEYGRHFSEWTVDDHPVELSPLMRYLCLREDNGWIGWARVGRTRITFVSDKLIGLRESFTIGETQYALTFKAARAKDVTIGGNLQIAIRHSDTESVCDVKAWFSSHGLDLISVSPGQCPGFSTEQKVEVAERVRARWSEVSEFAVRRMTKPFDYVDPLEGVRANIFFGDVGAMFQINLIKSCGNFVLVAKPL